MGNVFMPSVASSLNQASGESLLQILQQRAMEQEMQKQLFSQQRQGQQDLLSTGLRLRSADLADRKHGDALKAAELKSAADAKKAAEESRARLNTTNAAGMVFDRLGMDPTDRSPGLLRAAHEGKVGVSMLPKEPGKPELTPEQRRERVFEDTKNRVDAKNKFDPDKPEKGTKVAAEDIKAPPALRQEIQSYASSKAPGWRTVDEAKKSIEANWPKLRAKFGSTLDKAAVDRQLVNIYGTRPKAENPVMSVMREIEAEMEEARRTKP